MRRTDKARRVKAVADEGVPISRLEKSDLVAVSCLWKARGKLARTVRRYTVERHVVGKVKIQGERNGRESGICTTPVSRLPVYDDVSFPHNCD